ncbi:MAG: hypothetical protein K2O94_00950, partial [Clostridiales bacterium]|nr:hypothetical protein [Clostridiales bacterium]
QAIKFFMLAAQNGRSAAMFMLGQIYENGDGVEEDLYQAFAFYKAAAERGNQDAIKTLKKRKFNKFM